MRRMRKERFVICRAPARSASGKRLPFLLPCSSPRPTAHRKRGLMIRKATQFDLEAVTMLAMRLWPEQARAELEPEFATLLDGDEAFARVRGFLCDAAAIGACYREHVGPPSKPLKAQIRDLQRALGRAEVPGVPDELARLLAEEKEEGAEEGVRKVKEDWGDVDEEAW